MRPACGARRTAGDDRAEFAEEEREPLLRRRPLASWDDEHLKQDAGAVRRDPAPRMRQGGLSAV